MIDGLFDLEFRQRKLSSVGDPLAKLNACVPWEKFRPILMKVRDKERKSNAGRTAKDVVLMFKILVVQSLYNISDDALEYQINDRLSFMRFLKLSLCDAVPDAKTIWLFRDQLKELGLVEPLFDTFDSYLRANGFEARKGQIIDAAITEVPRQRNTREENEAIKNGDGAPEEWSENKKHQKDVEAHWTQKNNKNFYGYKNHVSIDNEHKLIRKYRVTNAACHDSQVALESIDENNSSAGVCR